MRILIFIFLLSAALTVRAQTPGVLTPADSVSQAAPAENAPVQDICGEEEVAEAEENEPLFEGMPDVMPTFNGGDVMSFHRWVMLQIRYPQEAMEDGIQGKVMVEYVIEKDGSVSEVTIVSSPDKRLSEEVMRVFGQESPAWTPAIQNGKAVRMKFSIPVHFRTQ